jgi:vacuolar-type H+-ATPase subunit I/STV1
MIRNFLLVCYFLVTGVLLIYGQASTPSNASAPPKAAKKKPQTLFQQSVLLTNQLRQSTLEKQQLQSQLTSLQKTISSLHDSISRQQAVIQELTSKSAQTAQVQATLTQRADELKTSKTQIKELEYDRKLLSDKQVVRIYHLPVTEVRQQFIRSLSAPESGFQYDESQVDDEIQVTRNFNDQANAWLVFDKTSDAVLELKIRIKQHLYDPQKTVVFGKTRLLQKTRYSNKPIEEQRDPEKIALYQEKLLRMLEGKLNGTSDK